MLSQWTRDFGEDGVIKSQCPPSPWVIVLYIFERSKKIFKKLNFYKTEKCSELPSWYKSQYCKDSKMKNRNMSTNWGQRNSAKKYIYLLPFVAVSEIFWKQKSFKNIPFVLLFLLFNSQFIFLCCYVRQLILRVRDKQFIERTLRLNQPI